MKFLDVVKELQTEEIDRVILVKNGIFFIAVGKDAIILNEKIGLKVTCMKKGMCKVGFLVQSSDKYIKLLEDKKISFGLYVIEKDADEAEEIYMYDGGESFYEMRQCLNCDECKNKKESDEEILNRLKERRNN